MRFANRTISRFLIASTLALASVAVTACGDDDSSSSSTTGAPASTSTTTATTTTPSGEGKKIAYLAAAKGNAYVDAAVKAITAEADKSGAELTIFDAQFNPQKQLSQCQDAVTQKFDAIVALPAAGVALIPCAAQAEKASIPFIATNQPIGTSITSGEPTAKGVTTQVHTPLAKVAGGDAEQAVAACGDTNPCKIVLLSAAKILPQQATAYQEALDKAAASNPNIKITVVDSGADRPGGLKGMQDTLQRVSDPTVVMSPNTQPIEGAVQALAEAGLTPGKDVKIVSNGATTFEIANVKSGKYFSTYTQLPATEAKLALQYAITASAGEDVPSFKDPHDDLGLPYEVTKDNISELGAFAGEW